MKRIKNFSLWYFIPWHSLKLCSWGHPLLTNISAPFSQARHFLSSCSMFFSGPLVEHNTASRHKPPQCAQSWFVVRDLMVLPGPIGSIPFFPIHTPSVEITTVVDSWPCGGAGRGRPQLGEDGVFPPPSGPISTQAHYEVAHGGTDHTHSLHLLSQTHTRNLLPAYSSHDLFWRHIYLLFIVPLKPFLGLPGTSHLHCFPRNVLVFHGRLALCCSTKLPQHKATGQYTAMALCCFQYSKILCTLPSSGQEAQERNDSVLKDILRPLHLEVE